MRQIKIFPDLTLLTTKTETSRHIEETVFGLENRMVLYVAHNATEYACEAADEVLCVRNGVIVNVGAALRS